MIESIKRMVGEKKTGRSKEELLSSIRKFPLPEHVAIIMDGNGRWAKKRGLPRTAGHAAGMKRVRETIRAADELGIKVLTCYSFSTENWKRPKDEVAYLMKLPIEFLKTDLQELIDRNVKVQMLGEKSRTPSQTQLALTEFEEKTKHNTGLILNFAINYGSREEIVQAIREIIDEVQKGNIDKDQIDQDLINQHLLTRGLPDPDLIIRTSGEIRISNFLLWQLAYSELWFTDALWPDFTPELFYQAIEDFQRRSRRYGAV
ncbi:isoprenyl transferase [Paenactinomyces guangxiensis]|uniref:Isoprenyl transferase n=1 Tax=Paenactinomyces guangxiensis TaxID=1490290 RepID=A0A7W1WUD7_9BACL|nr:isoprenyl transferase [Paenactinomyces guangxiensis]MBA4496236.1 isoprenyl transferase [Paenactinomyces guangxiensis]MBH8593382.1 isoprenyl transferase [Paenactinomyces guangxiensis]